MSGSQAQSSVNPGFGRLRLVDYFVLVYCIIWLIAWELPILLLTYPFMYPHTTSTSFAANIQHFLVRTTNYLLTPTCIRFLMRPTSEHVTAILSSPRYSRYRENMNDLVERPRFTGYWVLRGSFKIPKAPCKSDITILHLHGGGYFSSQPAHYLLFLLRLAESILERGVSVSIFALDYSLAPEHLFPAQLDEATAAYKYLTSEEQIPASSIVVLGDSAGGHLALSFLMHLDKLRFMSSEEKALERPGGLVLMSPWLSLQHEPNSFTTNRYTDVLSGPFLRLTARRFLGPGPIARGSLKVTSLLRHLLNECIYHIIECTSLALKKQGGNCANVEPHDLLIYYTLGETRLAQTQPWHQSSPRTTSPLFDFHLLSPKERKA